MFAEYQDKAVVIPELSIVLKLKHQQYDCDHSLQDVLLVRSDYRTESLWVYKSKGQ